MTAALDAHQLHLRHLATLAAAATAKTDYPLKSAPTISESQFAGILKAANSPAASEAAGIYQAFVAKGINPAIGLAIAQHESSFGKAGIAVGRNNLFGNRYYAGEAGATNAGGWAKFTSYVANAQYEAGLLAGPLYGGNPKFDTAQTFAYRYAPSGDGGNNPNAYGNAIVAAVTKWGGTPVPLAMSSTGVSAKTSAANEHALLVSQYLKAHPKTAAAAGGLSVALLAVAL
jgi:hypothetical protein